MQIGHSNGFKYFHFFLDSIRIHLESKFWIHLDSFGAIFSIQLAAITQVAADLSGPGREGLWKERERETVLDQKESGSENYGNLRMAKIPLDAPDESHGNGWCCETV